MTYTEAWHIIHSYYFHGEPEDDTPAFQNACHYLIDAEKDYQAAVDLGGRYYSEKDYDNALKYYSLAAEHDVPYGYIGSGYIWYYGRTGTIDYEKAYDCFCRALYLLSGFHIDDEAFWKGEWKIPFDSEEEYVDYINTVYKLADMYRNGFYVVKDEERYISLITHLHDMMTSPAYKGMPVYSLPEIDLRLADITLHHDHSAYAGEHALQYLSEARYVMQRRLVSDGGFFGDFNIMKNIEMQIYQIAEFIPEEMDLYDLYYVMQKPCRVTFFHENYPHVITAVKKDNGIVINADHRWYASIDEYMQTGKIDGESIPAAFENCDRFSVEKTNAFEQA